MENLQELLKAQKQAFLNHAPLETINEINLKIYALREQKRQEAKTERERARTQQQEERATQHAQQRQEQEREQ